MDAIWSISRKAASLLTFFQTLSGRILEHISLSGLVLEVFWKLSGSILEHILLSGIFLDVFWTRSG
jgi:hypothetical protein